MIVEDVTLYGNDYKKITVPSSMVESFASDRNTISQSTADEIVENYSMEMYYTDVSDDCVYTVVVMNRTGSTPPSNLGFFNIKYGDIDY